KQEPQEIDF
nr:Chain B, CD40 antigen [Homo sapiens]